MPNPTRQEIIDAHNALDLLYKRAAEVAPNSALKTQVLEALPPKPRPTMDEVKWDDDKHYLAEAATASGDKVIMLWAATLGRISVINNGIVGTVTREYLTPTGRRYTLTEVQDD